MKALLLAVALLGATAAQSTRAADIAAGPPVGPHVAAPALPLTERFSVDDAALALQVAVKAPDLAALHAEDAARTDGPLRVGVVLPLTKDVGLAAGKAKAETGQVLALADGRQVWRTVINAPGAVFMELDFSNLVLPMGAELFAFDPDGKLLRGPITIDDLDATPRHRLPAVDGETAVVEILAPVEVFGSIVADIESVAYGYRGLGGTFMSGASEKAASCNVDVACPEAVRVANQVDSVGQFTLIKQVDGRRGLFNCSGQLVANTRRDATPFFLTARHCLADQLAADSVVVYWNYESATCRSPGSASSGVSLPRSISSHAQSGAGLVATFEATDFSLLLLSRPVPAAANLVFSGWDRRDFVPLSTFSRPLRNSVSFNSRRS